MGYGRIDSNDDLQKHSSVLAEDLKLEEFILTKPEDRLKRKGSDFTTPEENVEGSTEGEYEESEEELAMIMKKGGKICQILCK